MQTPLYTEDWIGLKALDDAGKVKYIAVEGGHQEISIDDMKKHVVPYLTGQAPGSEKDDDHVGVGAHRAARNSNRKKIYNANQTPQIYDESFIYLFHSIKIKSNFFLIFNFFLSSFKGCS